jgi:hypothetical protein
MTGSPKHLLFHGAATSSPSRERWLVARDAAPGALLLAIWISLWAGVALAVSAPADRRAPDQPTVVGSSQVVRA